MDNSFEIKSFSTMDGHKINVLPQILSNALYSHCIFKPLHIFCLLPELILLIDLTRNIR